VAGTTERARPLADGEQALLDPIEQRSADAALRESEARFQQFASSSSDALWIRNAKTFAFEYVSPAVEAIYGVKPEAVLADDKLLSALVVPEERDAVSRRVERVARGEVVVQEYRIQRLTDLSFRWIRSTGFPLIGDGGRIARIGSIAQDITEAKLSAEHQGILLAELQHRVRNIMAIVHSIAVRSGDRAGSVAEYSALLSGRLMALARVQTLLTRAANAGVDIRTIVEEELGAQASHQDQIVIEGPKILLSPKAVEVLTLAIHELTTNAAKYGALAAPNGRVAVRWDRFEKRGSPWLQFHWTEEVARRSAELAAPRRNGFGIGLIEGRTPYELGGRGKVTIEPGGARCYLEFPLESGASIFETNAPKRASVFGGSLDMRGGPDLSGQRILVLEDDYFLATDTALALRGVGADVIGPCRTEEAARSELGNTKPTAAVVDVNLGNGPSFVLASDLKGRGVPFVFITGYDDDVIPAAFDGVQRLQKPVEPRQLVARPNSWRHKAFTLAHPGEIAVGHPRRACAVCGQSFSPLVESGDPSPSGTGTHSPALVITVTSKR